ncbi:MAG: RNA-binding protein [Alphaproteobacteria bacterium]|jgi:predicted RNA-binding protein YlxR (DUF448 family)|nr:RNA-binding protein [Alphaproteobacteria bacterium]
MGSAASARSAGAADNPDQGPTRRCVVTRRVLSKGRLIRFVVSPDGVLTPDLSEKLPGRGYWVSADRAVLERALTKGYFSRAAKVTVRAPDGLLDHLVAALGERCRNTVELARRAGQAVSGFEKVRAWALSGRAAVLVTASDGAENGRKKLEGLAAGRPLVVCLDSAALSTAFGRGPVIHAALAGGALAERLVTEAGRLSGLTSPRAGPSEDTPKRKPPQRLKTGGSITDENDG